MRGCGDVARHDEVGRAFAGARDEQARSPAQQREHDHQPGERCRVAAILRREPADDGAEQDRHEGRAFDQRVAGRQFGAGEMIRQDAVLDGAEQRADHAKAEQRDEQDGDRVRDESDDGDQRDADLGELEPLRHQRLVVAVGQFAAEPGEKEVRRDEHRRRQRDQRFRRAAPDLEQDQEHQRVLEKIVAECREELAPEQRREAPGHQERFGIGLGRGHGRHFMPMDCDGRQSRTPGGGDIPSFATDSGRTPGKRPLDGRKNDANQGISGHACPGFNLGRPCRGGGDQGAELERHQDPAGGDRTDVRARQRSQGDAGVRHLTAGRQAHGCGRDRGPGGHHAGSDRATHQARKSGCRARRSRSLVR